MHPFVPIAIISHQRSALGSAMPRLLRHVVRLCDPLDLNRSSARRGASALDNVMAEGATTRESHVRGGQGREQVSVCISCRGFTSAAAFLSRSVAAD